MKSSDMCLHFVLVAFGKKELFPPLIEFLQDEMCRFQRKLTILYNDDSIWKAEAHPERLRHSGRIRFPATEASRSYTGYFGDVDFDAIYHAMFDFGKGGNELPPVPEYTKEALLALLREKFCSATVIEPDPNFELAFGDCSLEYDYKDRLDNNVSVVLKLRISDTVDWKPLLSWFDAIIKEADEKFPAVLRSAYITRNAHDAPLVHTAVYDLYEEEDTATHLLGTEWSVYISRSILEAHGGDASRLTGLPLTELQNGIQYKATEDICTFDDDARIALVKRWPDLLIPAKRSPLYWSCLHLYSLVSLCPLKSVKYPFGMVHIYKKEAVPADPLPPGRKVPPKLLALIKSHADTKPWVNDEPSIRITYHLDREALELQENAPSPFPHTVIRHQYSVSLEEL